MSADLYKIAREVIEAETEADCDGCRKNRSDNKSMTEVNCMLTLCHLREKNRISCQRELDRVINMYSKYDNGWLEKPYGDYDLNHGSYGAVTTAIALYTVVEAIKNGYTVPNNDMEFSIHRVVDFLYARESNGDVLKNTINRSLVINTSLLIAFAVNNYIQLLDKRSIRVQLLNEMIARICNRTMDVILPNGDIRYHRYSLGTPILYQAMCTSILCALKKEDDSLVNEIIRRKLKARTLQYWNSEKNVLRWNMSKCPDKRGSIWAYGWMKNLTSDKEKYDERIKKILKNNGDQSDSINELYKALMICSMDMVMNDQNQQIRETMAKGCGQKVRVALIHLYIMARGLSCYIDTIRRLVMHRLYCLTIMNLGAYENQ